MNLLVLLNRIPYPLNDGGAIGAYNFVRGYAEANCNVTMLAMNTTKHFVDEKTVQEIFGKYGEVHTVNIDNKIKPLNALLNLFGNKSYVIERFISEEFERRLIEILSQKKFDVVHVDGLPPSAYIDVVRKYSNAKISMRAHNVEHVIWERIASEEKNIFKKIYLSIQAKRLKKYEINALAKCDVALAISREDEDTIKAVSPSVKTIIVPAGMDIDETLNSDYSGNDLFFIGSFDWLPNLQGIDWFFENAWNDVKQKFSSLKFFIAGKKMPEHIFKLKSENVIPLGEVPDAKKFILEHGIMLVPLVSGSGIRIKIVEAMALGKPVVATSIAAEGLGLTNEKNILIANNAPEFVTQIGKILNDISLRKMIGENAHTFALENFQNKRIFQKLTAYYRQII